MDANRNAPKASTGEISPVENKKMASEVVVMISRDEKDSGNLHEPYQDGLRDQKAKTSSSDSPCVPVDSPFNPQKAVPVTCSSPEIATFSPSANKPPKIPNSGLTRRKTLTRSVYSKPKSRFGEQTVTFDPEMFDEQVEQTDANVSNHTSPINKLGSNDTGATYKETARTVSVCVTPKTPLMASPGGFGGDDEHEEIYKKVKVREKLRLRKVKLRVLSEWSLFLCLSGCLIASLMVNKVQKWKIWDLEIWKWITLVIVIFNGLLVTKWFIHFLALLIELNFLLRKKVLYFVYSLKKSVRVCLWLSLVLVTWISLFTHGVRRTRIANRVMDYITWTITSLLIGAFLWLLKTLLLKILASSFHVNTFFDRIQVSIFHQYILLTLSGAAVMESAGMIRRTNSTISQLSFRRTKKGKDGKEKKEKEIIDINKLHQMKREKVSAWTMKMLVDVISNTGLSTISGSFDESTFDGEYEQPDKEITTEEEALAAAYHIFRNVAQQGSK